MASKIPAYASYTYHAVASPRPFVAHVQIERAEKLNAYKEAMWLELRHVFDQLSVDPDVRVVILSGAGDRAFTAGLDVSAASQDKIKFDGDTTTDVARRAVRIRRHIFKFQECVTAVEKCEKPVICVMHGISFGLGMDLSCCADIRLCAKDTKFSVKEVDIGLAADIGTLCRLPRAVGNASWVKEVCLSARLFGAAEALAVGYVSQVLETKAAAVETAMKMADLIASKSPVAVQGTKELLNHARDNIIAESLRYTAIWNTANLQTKDVDDAMLSGLKKTKPRFEKL